LFVVYPPVVAGFLAAYGIVLKKRGMIVIAGLIAACWFASAGWRGYRLVRTAVAGFDYLAAGLALFVLAIIVSLSKSASRNRGLAARREKIPNDMKLAEELRPPIPPREAATPLS
jgi:hypothetical protein